MDFLKKFSFQLSIGLIVILLIINVISFSKAKEQYSNHASWASNQKQSYKQSTEDVKMAKEEMKKLEQDKAELEREVKASNDEYQKMTKEIEKTVLEKENLIEEKEELLRKNDNFYTYDLQTPITNEAILNAIKIATADSIDLKSLSTKVSETQPSIGVAQNDNSQFILFAYDRFVAVYKVTDKEQLQNITIVDTQRQEIIAEETYSNIPIS